MNIKKMKNKSLTLNAILNTFKTLMGIIFPLITFPYISRIFQVETLGVYDFSSSLVSYFQQIAALGIATYAIREGSQCRDDKEKINTFINEIFTINVWSTIVAYVSLIIVLVIFRTSLNAYIYTIAILSTQILFTTIGVNWIYNIYEDFLAITCRTLLVQLLSLIGIFAFVKEPDDVNNYAAIVAFASSGVNLFNYFHIRKKFCRFRFVFDFNLKKHLKPILIIFSTSVAIMIYVSSDTIMLGVLTDDYEVGLYSTAVKIYTIVKNILAAVLMVLIPRFSILLNNSDKTEANALFSKVFNMLSMLVLPVTIGLFMVSKNVIYVISGTNYLPATTSLKLLSVAVTFSLYAFMFTQCILIPLKMESIVFKATLLSAIVNITLNFIMIPLWGGEAAALTTVFAELIIFIITFVASKKYICLHGVCRNMISVIVGCISIIVVCGLTESIIENLYLELVGAIVCSVISYTGCLFLLKNPYCIAGIKFVYKIVASKKQ